MASYRDLIGREKVKYLEEILGISNRDIEGSIHAVRDNADALFTWDCDKGERPALNKLYERRPRRRSGTVRPICPGTST